MEDRLRRHIKILEQMEMISRWIVGMDAGVGRKERAIKRHMRSVFVAKYMHYKKLAKLNIEGKLCRDIKALKSHEYYERKSSRMIECVFKGFKMYGEILELEGIFKKYMHVHECDKYEDFIGRIHELEIKEAGMCGLMYLDELQRYILKVMKARYYRRFKRIRKKCKLNVLNECCIEDFIKRLDERIYEKEGSELYSRVYCVGCSKEVCTNVFRYHVNGSKHMSRAQTTVLYCSRPIVSIKDELKKMLLEVSKELNYIITFAAVKKEKHKKREVPRWLYKKKDLDVEFECEVCGYVCHGWQDFDLHFESECHLKGMKRYGVGLYSKLYWGITRVDTLMRMKARVASEEQKEALEYQEEFEDCEGNVFDKRTYEDLKRNGLV
ncbi:subunit 3 of splicing factor 3a [Ordospora colligata]|uniref:Subunit 3 of splicing factor 3a n=1 Tax=Ordospora colligata OC4 TaxID=1354746 RepID=A0A0B2UK66_9MICR|nr:subunit 3 of splicing factor 3a [Ordospora colligata OC4]KHN69375.1 subunit 3 of splicing factor 3a [Ordospora colligata OC4]TBU14889.1 subunit 3 of splicing factor 3a [Ordospora colligata]TBU15020.1 subunit 3 of splicing factor 3a [Ordospora colligata]TBU18274.1 subunit 3 of splicing factor 3a [Ordospora colligata]